VQIEGGTPLARVHIFLASILVPGLFHAAPAFASDKSSQLNPVVLPDASNTGADAVALNEPLLQQFGNAPFGGVAVVDEAKLADVTGMADVKVVEQSANVRNTSAIWGNIINGDPTTGTISIDGGSFGGFSGLALVSANTGNNVSINSAMNVNVAIQ
jgi:hypothetical protein